MAFYKRMVQLGRDSGVYISKLRSSKVFNAVDMDATPMKYYSSLCSRSCVDRFDYRQISQLATANEKRVFLVDTLALVRSLEAQGVPSKQAEAVTAAVTEVLNGSLENVAHSFASKPEMQKTEMVQESNLSKFKSEVQSSQDHHLEKLQNHTEEMRIEMRYDFDKLRDELAKQTAEFTNLTNKLDKELARLSIRLEAVNIDVIKYYICTLVSISVIYVGGAIIRVL